MIDLEISKMYGLNNSDDFKLQTNSRHNFIYGINAAGKSSITKALTHLLNKMEYKKIMHFDEDDFSLKLNFENVNVNYNNHINIDNLILDGLENEIFIFNKDYAKNNLNVDTQTGGYPEIGIRIAERQKLFKIKEESITSFKKQLDSSIKQTELPLKLKDFYDKSIIKDFYKIGTEKINIYENAIKQLSTITLDKNLNVDFYLDIDFYGNVLFEYTRFTILISEITKDIVENIKQRYSENNYKIKNIQEKNLYMDILNYFESNDVSECPICLSPIDKERIYLEIKTSIELLNKTKNFENFDDLYIKIKDVKSNISDSVKNIYENLIQGVYLEEDIKKIIEKINDLKDNYDALVINKIGIVFDKINADVDSLNFKIEEINTLNREITNDKFIIKFDEMLNYIFKDDTIRANSKLVDNTITIQISFKGKDKEGIDVESFYSLILSESQKTKLSLAFFLAIVTYKNRSGNILCVFDDPIDSYDSISKYELSRIIYEFITKKKIFQKYQYNCFDIILSHSIDYFRLFYQNFRKDELNETSYYILSKLGLKEIDVNKLFVIEGDFNVLNNIIGKNQSPVSVNELIAITPIIRELSNISNLNFKLSTEQLKLNQKEINEVNKFISNKIIHGLFRSNVTLEQMETFLKEYMVFNLDYGKIDKTQPLKKIIEDIIEKYKDENLNFYEEIIYKNIIAIYIRAAFDEIATLIIKRNILPQKNVDEIHAKNNRIADKINVIRTFKDNNRKNTLLNQYNTFIVYVMTNLMMFNEFGHSANIFLTPLIDVPIDNIYRIYNEFFDIEIDGIKIKNIIC